MTKFKQLLQFVSSQRVKYDQEDTEARLLRDFLFFETNGCHFHRSSEAFKEALVTLTTYLLHKSSYTRLYYRFITYFLKGGL